MKFHAVWLWMISILVIPVASAQRPPETHPSSINQNIVLSWDRSSLPADIVLVPRRTVLGYEIVLGQNAPALDYGHLFLTCHSGSDASTGRCPAADTGQASANATSRIALRFTEQRVGVATDIEVEGGLYRIDSIQACSSDYWSPTPSLLWSSYALPCNRRVPAGTGIFLHVPTSELRRLVAGRWKAELRLDVRRPPEEQLANYSFTFDFTITDRNAVAIYLPEFHQASPSVGLRLRYEPIAGTLHGRRDLDMCLYDGLGSQASFLGLTVRDTGGRTPGPTGFSVWHDAGGNEVRKRIDYTLTLNHAGTRVPLSSGVEHQLHDIESGPLKQVILPGMTHPVLCVPASMTFETPTMAGTSKEPGHYTGGLQVQLRVPTSSP